MEKEKSDMLSSSILGGEPSGIAKFNHNETTIETALCLDNTAKTRIIEVLSSIHGNCSATIEAVLTSDKLHNTVERLLACYMAGASKADERNMHMVMKLMSMLDK